MKSAVTDALASYAEDWTIVRELHDVPPYRVYEVRLDGRRFVLKIDDHPRGHAATEGSVQRYVAETTSVPVPPVLAVGDDHFVAEWDDDAPQEVGPMDEAWARAVGAGMGTLHAETAGYFESYGHLNPDEDGLQIDAREDWLAVVRDRLRYHRSFIDDYGYADVADAVLGLLDRHPHAFDGAGEPVLCHGNVHPEHVAVVDGEAVSVIDFEHALVAPGEYDYWRIAMKFEGLDAAGAVHDAFREGYESVHPLPDGFERRTKCYWALNVVAYVESLFLQKNVEDPEERTERGDWYRTFVSDLLDDLRPRLE